MASAVELKALVNFYLRAGYSRQLIALCDDSLKRRGTDPVLVFWRAFGSAREGNFAAAIRDCESLRTRKDAEFAALTALVYYHRNSKQTDRDALLAVCTSYTPGALVLSAVHPCPLRFRYCMTGRIRSRRRRWPRFPRCARPNCALSVAHQSGAAHSV
jgi:hypothetical protein